MEEQTTVCWLYEHFSFDTGRSVWELSTEEGEHSIFFDLYSELDGGVGVVESVEKVLSSR